MTTVTIPQKEYRSIKDKAALFDRMVRPAARIWSASPVEEYSQTQIQDLLKADRLPKKTIARLTRLLKFKSA